MGLWITYWTQAGSCRLVHCIEHHDRSMTVNGLELNADKT